MNENYQFGITLTALTYGAALSIIFSFRYNNAFAWVPFTVAGIITIAFILSGPIARAVARMMESMYEEEEKK